jgi:hypothetical protein
MYFLFGLIERLSEHEGTDFILRSHTMAEPSKPSYCSLPAMFDGSDSNAPLEDSSPWWEDSNPHIQESVSETEAGKPHKECSEVSLIPPHATLQEEPEVNEASGFVRSIHQTTATMSVHKLTFRTRRLALKPRALDCNQRRGV